jgi:predicted phosphodiesterase
MKIEIDKTEDADQAIALLKKENRKLKRDIESMNRHVDAARSANQKKYITKTRKRRKKADWVRAILPDVHGSSVDRDAFGAVMRDLKGIDVDEVILLGDFLECGGFLAQHHTLGYVAQTEYTYENDIAAANQCLDAIMEACPNARDIHYLEGNHEARVEKWAVTQALRNGRDAQFLLDQIGPEKVLNLQERGVKYYRQSTHYHDLAIPGTIRLGKCFFTHGISAAKHAASVHSQRFGGNICYGHTHRKDTWETKTVDAGDIGAWCPGCLCVKQPMWQHTNPTSWTNGYGIQVVARSGNFLPLQVRVIDGQSMFLSLKERAL